jgi:hypothetical protein
MGGQAKVFTILGLQVCHIFTIPKHKLQATSPYQSYKSNSILNTADVSRIQHLGRSRVELGVSSFDDIGALGESASKMSCSASVRCAYLLADHVDRVLDAAVRNDRDDRGIDDTQVLSAVDAELGVNDTLLDALGETIGTARVYMR